MARAVSDQGVPAALQEILGADREGDERGEQHARHQRHPHGAGSGHQQGGGAAFYAERRQERDGCHPGQYGDNYAGIHKLIIPDGVKGNDTRIARSV